MTTKVRWGIAVGVALLLASPAAWAEEPAEEYADELERGRALCQQLYKGEIEALREQFSAEMQETFTLEVLDNHHRRMNDELGAETEKVGERVKTQGEYTLYVRQARFAKKEKDEIFELQWGWNQAGQVVGFMIKPVGR